VDDTSGNRTRDLPACSAVPKPTAPPLAPKLYIQCIRVKRTAIGLSTSCVTDNKYKTLALKSEICISHVFGKSAVMFLEGCSQQ